MAGFVIFMFELSGIGMVGMVTVVKCLVGIMEGERLCKIVYLYLGNGVQWTEVE